MLSHFSSATLERAGGRFREVTTSQLEEVTAGGRTSSNPAEAAMDRLEIFGVFIVDVEHDLTLEGGGGEFRLPRFLSGTRLAFGVASFFRVLRLLLIVSSSSSSS